jgi:glycosyltransferase involved in cell wall biosynthesis
MLITMKVNVVHADLNPCGGAEQVAVSTIQALLEMGFDVDLTTARKPDIGRLGTAFGSDRIAAVFDRISRIKLLERLPIANTHHLFSNYRLTINTHGDILPYYIPSYTTKSQTITYCHYPLVPDLVRERDPEYFEYLSNLRLIKADECGREVLINSAGSEILASSAIWQDIEYNYLMMLKHSTIITNSTFSRDAILATLAVQDEKVSTVNHPEPIVIPPPVNVDAFRSAALYSNERDDDNILVISRFNPSKKLENAIVLAHKLKKLKIGKRMIIVGGLMPEQRAYYNHIVRMIKSSDLSDFVFLEANVAHSILESIMRKGKVYFHPMPGEPFGISTAEAMSAGLIPIVPQLGGHTDFVPQKYRFSTLEDAVAKIFSGLNASQGEREDVSKMVSSFTKANFIERIQQVIRKLLSQEADEIDVPPKKSQLHTHGTTAA